MVSRIQQSLSFHDSPESFISSRLQQLSVSDAGSLPSPERPQSIVKASILNRNVHIISSYRLCKAILNGNVTAGSDLDRDEDDHTAVMISTTGDVDDDQPVFVAEPAYKQFMSAFFPGPNILLQDGPRHTSSKERWKRRMDDVVSEMSGLENMIRKLTQECFVDPVLRSAAGSRTGASIDLYDAMKSLSWDLLFGIFLGLSRTNEKTEFAKWEKLQEDLLRGQFSLFPVPVRTPFWSSPRTKGLDAVKHLQELLAKRLDQLERLESRGPKTASACPFMQHTRGHAEQGEEEQSFDEDDMVAHLLVFTSSIANKALASLLTAFLMNLFLWRDGKGGSASSLAQLVRSQENEATKGRMLESILSETKRLSPPVVGVMRRVKQDIVLRPSGIGSDRGWSDSDYAVSNGHDAWLYLAGASRDPDVFEKADSFIWDRYVSDEMLDHGFAFGGGVKTCLGDAFANQICLTSAKTILESGLSLRGTVTDPGVKHWLGWEKNVPLETIAKDLKQLPCQRPRRPINVDAILAS
ncbi:hypothetical protein H2200_011400 [Cladophialophora chaetospira]|uniref:Cytochrome P450 n=1 Tax=Cladophialophora chaetospira TaxID=386627 RepID=A0AA39CD36_9EURO|nr:hypothetical protein H2200_011400 [Cladophialophora chaetospira]